jgi:hypothetical protein
MSNRRLPKRPPLAPPAEADPLNGLDTPEAIEALERAAEELVKGSNLEPRELVRGLLADEGDRQVLERGLALIQHNLENGINTLKVQFAEPRNTADARLTARALQRLSKALMIFNEDTGAIKPASPIVVSSSRVALTSVAKNGAYRIGQIGAVVSCCVSSSGAASCARRTHERPSS